MRIGYDGKRFFHNTTGLGNYSRDLVRIMAKFYPKNNYILYNPKPKKIDRIPIDEKLIKEVLPVHWLHKKTPFLWRQQNIVKQLIADKISIFHGLSAELPRGIQNTSIKSIVTVHDLIFLRYPKLYNYIDRTIYKNKVKFALQHATGIIAISEQTKADIITYFKINPEKINVIYQGCHTVFKDQYSKSEKAAIKTKYKLPETFILNVGTIEERKNALTLIKAIQHVNASVVLVGKKTKYYNTINAFAEKNQLEDKLIHLEKLSLKELAIIYQLAKVFVYPSFFEGFGIPIIEALYSGTPVITNQNGCFKEVGGPNSIYISPTDSKMLAEQLNNVLNNKDLAQTMIEEGRTFVSKFDDDKIALQLNNYYESL